MPQLSQATIVAGAILGAFILYLAMNQRFPVYYAVLFGPAGTAAGGGGSTTTPPAATLDPTSPGFNPMEYGRQLGCTVRSWFGGTC